MEVILEELAMFSRPPEKSLPPHPSNMQHRFSIHSSNSSEVSRNNANLPDGWVIKMTDDGKSWFYYNERTGQSATQNPSLFNFDDTAIDTSRRGSVYSSDETREFQNVQEPTEELEQEKAPTVKEVSLINFNNYSFVLQYTLYSSWTIGLNEKRLKVDLIFVI